MMKMKKRNLLRHVNHRQPINLPDLWCLCGFRLSAFPPFQRSNVEVLIKLSGSGRIWQDDMMHSMTAMPTDMDGRSVILTCEKNWHLKLQTMSTQSTPSLRSPSMSKHVFCLWHNCPWGRSGYGDDACSQVTTLVTTSYHACYHKLLDDFWSFKVQTHQTPQKQTWCRHLDALTVRREQVCCTLQGCFLWTFQHDISALPNLDHNFALWILRDSTRLDCFKFCMWKASSTLLKRGSEAQSLNESQNTQNRKHRKHRKLQVHPSFKKAFLQCHAMRCQTFRMCFHRKAILAAAEFQISDQAESLRQQDMCIYIILCVHTIIVIVIWYNYIQAIVYEHVNM